MTGDAERYRMSQPTVAIATMLKFTVYHGQYILTSFMHQRIN